MQSRRAKFSIWRFENSEFGMVTMVRSSVRTRVERRPTSSTVPTVPPKRQNSPTRTGWSA